MRLPRNILVPTDFSDSAEKALDYAVALAAKLDATVHVLHVVGVAQFGAEFGITVTTSMVDNVLRDAKRQLDVLVVARRSKVAIGPPRLETGDARMMIDAVASEVSADLIVMATHGRRGMSRILLGSVAESVSRTSRCPVLLVRAEAVP